MSSIQRFNDSLFSFNDCETLLLNIPRNKTKIIKYTIPHGTQKYWTLAKEHGTQVPERNAYCTCAYNV